LNDNIKKILNTIKLLKGKNIMLEQTRKFYIMERTDNNGALTFYLNEVGESKNPEKLKDFKEVLQKFLDILKNYTGKALVYFHAN